MTTISDGSTASYYELPKGCTELQDLISYRNLNAQDGEIFRAIYRKGRASHSDELRDAKKVLFYARAEVARLEALQARVDALTPPAITPVTFHERVAEIDAEIRSLLSEDEAPQELCGDCGRAPYEDHKFGCPHRTDPPQAEIGDAPDTCPGCGREEGKKHRRGCPTLTQHETDMTNWRNWREGDKLVCIQHYSGGDEPEQKILVSEVVEVAQVECTGYEGALAVELHGHLYKGWVEVPGDDLTAYFRWHSRPTP